ncbi:XrtA/PEP-CTERM system histidine kinase PrsK [Allosphingosinicella sp.]|jgi:putative PEP-CTERM system histidine kinase|uniref:XrtA/PEP-CTERM system histidine kinase PrsK n=1 Tax=Allosphingosinicella sp. TaxID=2823234 RepID=UPI002F1705FF
MVAVIGLWSHLLAAALYGALAIWQLRHWNGDHRNRPLVTAFAVMAVWCIYLSMKGPHFFLAQLAESGRNLAFLAFMYGIMSGAAEDSRQRAVKVVYAAVSGVIGLQIVIGGVMNEFQHAPRIFEALASTQHIMGLTIAAGSLVLVHNLYGQASPNSRWGIQLPMLALAAMWAYDLHLYTVAYLTRGPVEDLFAMRGAVLAMITPLFAMASRRNANWKMQLSRAATFQSLSVLAIFVYLVVMMSATRAMEIAGGDWARVGQVGLIFSMTIAALVLVPSGRARAWVRVIVAKHFFEHRYDYRTEWLRFTHTVGRGSGDGGGLEERVVKALADIGGSPGGLLLLADERGRLAPAARWNWHHEAERSRDDDDGSFTRFLASTSHVVDFTGLEDGLLASGADRIRVPAWIASLPDLWAGVPLIHGERLVGLVVLDHPLVRRPLDWEDFDLFRTAGIQAASYIAESQSQQALTDSQRFDEFNRRFAFIMHDIKNLVSQLSLVARNAERHSGNPEFRADMVVTLQGSVKKMHDLLARLSNGDRREGEPSRPILVQSVVAAVAGAKRRAHPIEIEGDPDLVALADPGGLEQALAHLVQNAIDATRGIEPVSIRFSRRSGEAAVEVTDRGAGMSTEFVRTRLFQPFASTKDSGFGVGAYEAKSLVAAMGGRIEVESRESEGTSFTVFLPLGEQKLPSEPERMRA